MFFPGSNITFYVLYPVVTCLLTVCLIHPRDDNDPEFHPVAPSLYRLLTHHRSMFPFTSQHRAGHANSIRAEANALPITTLARAEEMVRN
jgi:hypothetical protein